MTEKTHISNSKRIILTCLSFILGAIYINMLALITAPVIYYKEIITKIYVLNLYYIVYYYANYDFYLYYFILSFIGGIVAGLFFRPSIASDTKINTLLIHSGVFIGLTIFAWTYHPWIAGFPKYPMDLYFGCLALVYLGIYSAIFYIMLISYATNSPANSYTETR